MKVKRKDGRNKIPTISFSSFKKLSSFSEKRSGKKVDSAGNDFEVV
jgi:hypothetical protein